MKTLTTLTVAAALAAGMSVAGAQTSMQKPSSMDTHNSTMSKSAYTVKGTRAYCTKTATGSSLNCQYASMAACEKVAKPGTKICMRNPHTGTTGSGVKK